MEVQVRLFATLREGRFKEARIPLKEGALTRDLMKRLAIPESEASLVLVNGQHADPEQPLREGDTVSLFPPIGGG